MTSMHPGRRTAVSLGSERPRGPGQPCLVIIAGDELGRRIDLSTSEIGIGRSEQCTICVNSDLVSRRHASISCVLGRYCLVDMGSTNGTFVNDARVERAELKDGDLIRVGKTILKYLENSLELEYMQRIFALASADSLTGAANKRLFDDALSKEVGRARLGHQALSLVLFDVDHFKRINDQHGHAAGDAVLKQVVAKTRQALGEGSTVYRVGGEEFALLFAGVPQALAVQAAERVRSAIADAPFDHEQSPIPVTVSLGIAELGTGEGAQDLYKRADAKLYRAKHAGRNRVC